MVTGIFYQSENIVQSQLTSYTDDFVKTVTYSSCARKDSLFVFYSPRNVNKKGNLTVSMKTAGNFNYSWSKYNPATKSFDSPFLNQTNVLISVAEPLSSGGYKVRAWNGLGKDTTFLAWVLIDSFRVRVLKDAQGKVLSSQYTCDYITVNGFIDSVKFTYYDTITHAPVTLPTGYTFLWTSDNKELIIPWPDTSLVSNRSYNPPYKDTRYVLTATDKFGLKLSDSVLYESIVVKPDFTFQVYDKEKTKTFIDATKPYEDDAPFRVKFTNKSVNGASYEWVFSDKIRSKFFANEFTQDLDYQPEYSYNIPGAYYPAIIVTSAEGCVDSMRLSDSIVVKPSLLEVPNVFSPDGDSFNDFFKVKHQSIKEFNIKIFNRNGRIVYKAEIKDLYEWEGWNGNILNTGRPASPGPYYYVIEATGWDDEKYNKGQYAGVVYLFREGD